MSKYNSTLKYVASTPRSQRKGKGARYYGSTIPSLPSAGGVSLSYVEANFVTLNTEQAISGIKDFTNGLKVGGLSVYKSQADTIYLDCNLVVRGGVTAFGTNKTITASIFEALPIDGITLKRTENGVLYVASGGSGGTGGGISIADVENYLTTNGYATQSWVTDRGYITSASSITGNAATATKLKNSVSLWGRTFDGSADLTGSLNVTTGEGYRINYNGYDLRFIISGSSANRGIWDNTNNNWLMYRSGSNDIYFTSGNIGFGTTSPTEKVTVGGNVKSTGHFNTTSANSHYLVKGREVIGSFNANYFICDSAAADGYRTHLVGKSIAFQTSTSKVTNALLDESGNFSITGVMSLPIVPSNAFSGAQLLFAGGVGRIGVNTNNMMAFYADTFRLRPASTGSAASSIGVLIDKDSNLSTTGDLQASGVLRLPVIDSGFANPRIVFGDSIIRIGATTAGLLGVYASGDIRINPNSATSANSTMGLWLKASGYNGINISSPTQALHVNGKGIFADATNPWVSLQRDGVNWYVQVTSGGMRIGRSSGLGVLIDASGNMLTPGGITANYSSDRRLKQSIRKFNASKVLMSLGAVWEYEYIDSEVQKNRIYEGTHYGLIYQHVKGTKLDVMCHEREDGMGALNYIHPKFISLIAGATMEAISEIEKLKRENRKLKKRVEQLEKRIV